MIHDLLQPNLGEAKVRQLMARAREMWIVTIKDSYIKRARPQQRQHASSRP